MGCNMITLCTRCSTVLPFARQAQIVGTLSTDVVVAEMIVECLWIGGDNGTGFPLAAVALLGLLDMLRRRLVLVGGVDVEGDGRHGGGEGRTRKYGGGDDIGGHWIAKTCTEILGFLAAPSVFNPDFRGYTISWDITWHHSRQSVRRSGHRLGSVYHDGKHGIHKDNWHDFRIREMENEHRQNNNPFQAWRPASLK